MRSYKLQYGMHNGRRYILRHCPISDVLSVDLRTWAWHLFAGGESEQEYVGNFRTKREALTALEEIYP